MATPTLRETCATMRQRLARLGVKVPVRTKRERLISMLALLSMSPTSLPLELWCEISAFLDARDILELAATCRMMRRLDSPANDAAWRAVLERDYGKLSDCTQGGQGAPFETPSTTGVGAAPSTPSTQGGQGAPSGTPSTALAQYNRANGKQFASWYAAYRAVRAYVQTPSERRGKPWLAAVQALTFAGDCFADEYMGEIHELSASLPRSIRMLQSFHDFIHGLRELYPPAIKLAQEDTEKYANIYGAILRLHTASDIRLLEMIRESGLLPISGRTGKLWAELLSPWCCDQLSLTSVVERFGLRGIVPQIARHAELSAVLKFYEAGLLSLGDPTIEHILIAAAVYNGDVALVRKVAAKMKRRPPPPRPKRFLRGGWWMSREKTSLICQIKALCAALDAGVPGIVATSAMCFCALKELEHPSVAPLAMRLLDAFPREKLSKRATTFLIAAGPRARELIDRGYIRPGDITLRGIGKALMGTRWRAPKLKNINKALDVLADVGVNVSALPTDLATSKALRSAVGSMYSDSSRGKRKGVLDMFARLGVSQETLPAWLKEEIAKDEQNRA